MTILLVTVDNAIQQKVRSALQFSKDAAFHTSRNLQIATEQLQKDRSIRVALIDLRTPDLGGLKAVEKLASQHPSLDVFLMDQAPSMAIGNQALRVGIKAYVPTQLKPEALADLLALSTTEFDLMMLPRAPKDGRAKSALLSRRELQVLSLLCDGQQNKEIAHAFGIQEVTVKMHMRSVIRKLGARNRTHAAMIARDQGLV